jgi:hypothetical protein
MFLGVTRDRDAADWETIKGPRKFCAEDAGPVVPATSNTIRNLVVKPTFRAIKESIERWDDQASRKVACVARIGVADR